MFQWKSDGTNDQHHQNCPVIMKVEDSRLKVWYVAPGEQWIPVASVPWSPEVRHKIELGIHARSGTAGWFEVHLDGTRIAGRTGVQTWDVLGNKPRWGSYGSTIADEISVHWINGLRMGTSRGDV